MKVLYFHQHFTTPKVGGGTRSYEFAKALIKAGHQVTMVCGGDAAKFGFKETEKKGIYRGVIDGISMIQIALPYSNNDRLLKRTGTFLKFAWKGIKLAFSENYDLLFATSTPLTAGLPGIAVKLLGKKKKFVFEVRDLWPELPKALGMKNPIALWGMSVLEWFSYHTADACVGLSPGICEGIKRRSQKNKPVEMIPNGCDLGLFQPGDKKQLQLKGIKDTDKVAVFTGAHGIANGLDAVLNAAKVLKERGRDDIIFVFIGDGKLKAHLVERAQNEGLGNCRFFDPIPKTQLNQIISSVDVGMMILANVPAFYYGTSPNKFFDYIASGLPVLNNYPGWLADMITENNLGIVVEPDKPEAFADGIVKLMDNPALRKQCGENSRKFAEKNFSRDLLSERFVKFLEKTRNE